VSTSRDRRCGAFGLALLAALAAAVPASAKVTVIVLNEGNKAVRSNVWMRVGDHVDDLETRGDGPYVFESMSCNDKIQIKIAPKIRLYVSEADWQPCKQRMVYRVRPYQVGAG
jgi:hypothetical protein